MNTLSPDYEPDELPALPTHREIIPRRQNACASNSGDYSPRLKPGASRAKPRLASPRARMFNEAL